MIRFIFTLVLLTMLNKDMTAYSSESGTYVYNKDGMRLFKKDDFLEQNADTQAERCLQEFTQKGGAFQAIPSLTEKAEALIRLEKGDAVYPICSGGFCRSQALWAILQPIREHIVLFPPHAARVGWDPYNGLINRCRNYAQEAVHDEFEAYFGMEKALRFGFENESAWKMIEISPSKEGLKSISQFYSDHYYGPESNSKGKKGKRRVYMAFSNNTHVALRRLNQTNHILKGVTLIAIESEDLVTYPPSFLATTPRSVLAYDYFTTLLRQVLDLAEFIPK